MTDADYGHVARFGTVHDGHCDQCNVLFEGIEWLVRLLWGDME